MKENNTDKKKCPFPYKSKDGHFQLRRRWDSNPRVPKDKLISSQPRYDHFDTSPDDWYLTSVHDAAKNRKSKGKVCPRTLQGFAHSSPLFTQKSGHRAFIVYTNSIPMRSGIEQREVHMKQKRLLLALALTGVVLSACGNNRGFELVDAPRKESSAGVEETKEVTELMEQEFAIITEVDDTIKPGEYRIVQSGERGQSNITYSITLRDGKEVSRKALTEKVVKKPVEAVIKIAPTSTHSKVGAREIIGYSMPTTTKYSKPTAIGTTMTDKDLALRILADAKIEKGGTMQAKTNEKPSTETSPTEERRTPDIRIVPVPSEKPSRPKPPVVNPKPPVIPGPPTESQQPQSSEESSSSESSESETPPESTSSSETEENPESKPGESSSTTTEEPPSPNTTDDETTPKEKPAQ